MYNHVVFKRHFVNYLKTNAFPKPHILDESLDYAHEASAYFWQAFQYEKCVLTAQNLIK